MGKRSIRTLLLALVWVVVAPAGASISIYMSVEDLAKGSALIVEGTVVRTASGHDPVRDTLATYVTLDVERVHRGPADLRRVVLREAGGTFGGLVHELDAVPVYNPGERVLVFLEPAPDGTLRTAGMFFGVFRIEQDPATRTRRARRTLDGHGTILRRPAGETEVMRLDKLSGRIAARGRGDVPRSRRWREIPPELSRLSWDAVRERTPIRQAAGSTMDLLPRIDEPSDRQLFVPAVPAEPARWEQSDLGIPVVVHIDRNRDPLGDPLDAVAQVEVALAAWSDAPEARIELTTGNSGFDYVAAYPVSPRQSYSGVNIVLFGDPYEDISDIPGCSGVLAVGGYWRSTSPGRVINGVGYYPALQLYVILNDDFECFLGDPVNMSEVLAHELGHGLGLGHSAVPDALMRASAYGQRGARLGDDDRDAAHCLYPHAFWLSAPTAGDDWQAGTMRTISWAASPKSGPDAGSVDLQYSVDDGSSWKTAATGVPNTGNHVWIVPDDPTAAARLRLVRHPLGQDARTVYPNGCSSSVPSAGFTISEPAIRPGAVPDGTDGPPLRLEKTAGIVRLEWSPSCSGEADDYTVYAGALDSLQSGGWSPAPLTCSTRSALHFELAADGDNAYYLIGALAGNLEGPFGRRGDGTLRAQSQAACAPRGAIRACGQASPAGSVLSSVSPDPGQFNRPRYPAPRGWGMGPGAGRVRSWNP